MTAVRQKKEEIGKLSIKLLFEEINLEKKLDKKKIIVPTEFIIRKSVKNLN
jgi:DNA-binding LacI/PurR family transcriptional regulator